MGIDAEMLIRKVPHTTVTDEWLRDVSWMLCSAIGSKHFFTNAKEGKTAIQRTLTNYREDDDPPPGSRYDQDGDSIYAEPGECLLKVDLWGRYYGVGYERGDILTYCAIAEWLEVNIPGCEVWYGGDSSGVCAEPFTSDVREGLRRHLYSAKGRDYYKLFSSLSIHEEKMPKPPACKLCLKGKYHGDRYGFGANYAAYSCSGCGKRHTTKDNDLTFQIEEQEL